MFECHITIPKVNAEVGEMVAKALHWKWSCIDGDPVLGRQAFGYLTTHGDEFFALRERMRQATHDLLCQGVPVIREKIEKIVYDRRY